MLKPHKLFRPTSVNNLETLLKEQQKKPAVTSKNTEAPKKPNGNELAETINENLSTFAP